MKYLKYVLLILAVLLPCIAAVLIYNDKIAQDSPVYYKQGVKLYNQENWQEAYYAFGRIKRISPLYPAAVFKQAKSAYNAGDYKTAALKYETYLKKMPDSIFSRSAHFNLAKSYYYLRQYEAAGAELEKTAGKNGIWGTEEVIFAGLAAKNYNKDLAAGYFRNYLNSVLSGTALNTDFIAAAAKELSIILENPSESDIKLIGTAYFKDKRYNEALGYFSKLPIESCWDYIVLSNYYAGNKKEAEKLIQNEIEQYAGISAEDNLREIYNIYAASIKGGIFKNRTKLIEKLSSKNLKGLDYILFKLAQSSSGAKAEAFYTEICRNYPDSRYAAEALWEIIYSRYKTGSYSAAEKLALLHLKKYKKVNSTPKTAFWLGKIYLKQHRNSDAASVFSRLVSKYPDNYYGLRSEAILSKKNNFWQTSSALRLPEKKQDIEFPASIQGIDLKDLKTINSLLKMGDYEVWIDADLSNPITESWFEYKKGRKTRSIVLARDAAAAMDVKPHITNSAYKLAYPVYMASDINNAASMLDIDPLLITAVIREESYFNEHAKSRTGASGLMQLMPATADYMIKRLKLSDAGSIENPERNLMLGCNYLRYLKNRFDSDLMVIAAYNGGEGAVNRWMKNRTAEDLDEFIEDIPFEETRHYVKKVFRTYHMYKKIYT